MGNAEVSAEPEPIRLSASSSVVLGLLAASSPQTTYQMMSYIELSIGFFWPFPTSQMYAETKRLEALGLITGQQEEHGRRRRQYSLTPAGHAALVTWLSEPVDRPTEIRDIGLLKLFLADSVPEVSVKDMALDQVRLHQQRLDEYHDIVAMMVDERPLAEHTIQLGIAFENVAIDFWQGVVDDA